MNISEKNLSTDFRNPLDILVDEISTFSKDFRKNLSTDFRKTFLP